MSDVIHKWLLGGDPAIRFQVYRDLLGDRERAVEEQSKIANFGWGKAFLEKRNSHGHWGHSFYQPKWISSHYTLLDLKNLGIKPDVPIPREVVERILKEEKGLDGGVNPGSTTHKSDVCVSGMLLNYASYFGARENELESIVDFLLKEWMPDGGFNCQSNRKGAMHSSLHSTISVMEGITEYELNGYQYRLATLKEALANSLEFIMIHHLFRSDHTGQVIDKKMLRFSYPCRWKYDVLRALDFFQYAKITFDKRMEEAVSLLLNKRRKEGTWPLQARHPGKIHFEMEKPGKPSRWNTLRALRVLKWYHEWK